MSDDDERHAAIEADPEVVRLEAELARARGRAADRATMNRMLRGEAADSIRLPGSAGVGEWGELNRRLRFQRRRQSGAGPPAG